MRRAPDVVDVFLQPGEYFVGDAECRIRTVLGSCVSVTLWHPVRRIGAMSHFVLVERGAEAMLMIDSRYGNEAIWLMLHELVAMRVEPSQCQAKIFGGASMFDRKGRGDLLHVGKRNGEAARNLLRSHGIPIVSESLFGAGHRQVIFDIASGDVWVRQVRNPGHFLPEARKAT